MGRRMRIARIAAELDPESVAAELGISRKSLERTEAGVRQPSRAELVVLAQLTGQELSFFGVTSDAAAGGAMLSDLKSRVNRGNNE